jgi:crossover junction endodeoxyribonuclease RuvC
MPRLRARSWRAFDPGAARGASLPVPSNGDGGARLRILGLDPGSRRTGYGLIDWIGGDSVHVAHGCVMARDGAMAERLRLIFESVEKLIAEHRPDEIAVESVFVNRNIDSALKLGQARGAALSAVPRGTPVFEYAPRAIKLSVVGFGGADKRQVAHMMCALLSLAGRIAADASDALAVAVCHAQSRRMHLLQQTARAPRAGGSGLPR